MLNRLTNSTYYTVLLAIQEVFFIKVKTKWPTLMQKYQLKRAEIKGEEDSATNNQHCPLQQTSPLQTGTKHEPQDRACWETRLQMKELSHSP